MTQKKLYLILQSVLYVLLVILLAASAVSIYREGVARKAEDPMAWIYTRETAAEKFKPIVPLFFGAIGLTVAGWILGVKDENAGKPVKDVEILRNLTVARVVTPSEAMKAEQEKQRKLFLRPKPQSQRKKQNPHIILRIWRSLRKIIPLKLQTGK